MPGYSDPGFDTLALHAGSQPDPATGARATPIHLTTSFVFESSDHAAALFNLERPGHVYSRLSNPTTAVLEQPLGIDRVQWNRASEGTGMGGGGTRYRARDIARIGELLRDGGQWRGRQVISAAWITAMLTPRAVPREAVEYGYQLWRFRFPLQGRDEWFWAMSGNGGNYVFVSPQRGLVAVITSTAYNQRESHRRSQEIFRDYVLAAMPVR